MDKAPDAFRTISEVADDLDVPQHVLRFWESRFPQIRPMKRRGGRRYYRPDDVDLLRGIHRLLYGQGYTIRGVQRILREQGPRFVQSVWQEGAPRPPPAVIAEEGDDVEEAARTTAAPGIAEHVHVDFGADDGDPAIGAAGRVDSAAESRPSFPGLQRAGGNAANGLTHGIGGADIQRLQKTLQDLLECKRRLDEALAEGA